MRDSGCALDRACRLPGVAELLLAGPLARAGRHNGATGPHLATGLPSGVRLTAGTLTALLRFYPSEVGGFFLQGGLGISSLEASMGGFSVRETGVGAVLGLGYDIRVAPNVSLTPFWNGVGLSFSDGDANFGQLGLSITVH